MSSPRSKSGRSGLLRRISQDYPWIHLGIGILGNTAFFVGSVFFLWEDWKRAGVWLFIIGSAGMLIGSLGRTLVDLAEREQRD